MDAETADGRDRGTAPRLRGIARRLADGRLHDVCRPLAGRIDRLPRGGERFQPSLGLRVSRMQIGMTGPDRAPESSPNVVPRRVLVDSEKGEERSFIRGASHVLQTLRGPC